MRLPAYFPEMTQLVRRTAVIEKYNQFCENVNSWGKSTKSTRLRGLKQNSRKLGQLRLILFKEDTEVETQMRGAFAWGAWGVSLMEARRTRRKGGKYMEFFVKITGEYCDDS